MQEQRFLERDEDEVYRRQFVNNVDFLTKQLGSIEAAIGFIQLHMGNISSTIIKEWLDGSRNPTLESRLRLIKVTENPKERELKIFLKQRPEFIQAVKPDVPLIKEKALKKPVAVKKKKPPVKEKKTTNLENKYASSDAELKKLEDQLIKDGLILPSENK